MGAEALKMDVVAEEQTQGVSFYIGANESRRSQIQRILMRGDGLGKSINHRGFRIQLAVLMGESPFWGQGAEYSVTVQSPEGEDRAYFVVDRHGAALDLMRTGTRIDDLLDMLAHVN
jgi:hypothetical protein